MTGPAVKGLQIPALPELARDVLGPKKQPKGKPLAPFDIKDPTTYANPILRQVVNPAMDNPITTGVSAAALPIPGLGQIVGGVMAGTMALDIARYGYQKHLETTASPEARKIMEADPERISGEAAAVQAAMLGLAPLIHVGVKGYRSLDVSSGMMDATGLHAHGGQMDIRQPIEIPLGERGRVDRLNPKGENERFAASLEDGAATARIPATEHPPGFVPSGEQARLTTTPRKVPGLETPTTETPGKVKPLETRSPAADAEAAAELNISVREYQAQRLAQDQADLSASRAADAERVAKADAMRPRRRAKANFFESETGAETLGATAGRHGLPDDANPYHPSSPLAALWTEGHAAATQTYPEGFSMGGALTDNRIPGADELPFSAQGIDGLQQSHPVVPEGATPETVALANALKPSPFRGHTTDALAAAALDAQTAIESAQAAVASTGEGSAEMQRFYQEQGDRTDFATSIDGNPFYAKTPELTLARAKSKLAQIEREFALRGVSGDNLAKLMQGAKEQRIERQAMQQEETLSGLTGEPAPTAAPVGAGTGSALAPVEGTGETRVRGLSRGVEEKALTNKLVTSLGDLPEYRQIKMADQAVRALDLLERDPALARQVAMGEAPAPDGLLPESVFKAVEDHANATGDVSTIYDLAHGKLTSEATTMGQRLRALGERDPDSPVAALRRVFDIQMNSAKNVPKASASLVADLRAKLKGGKITQTSWAEFIDSLRC